MQRLVSSRPSSTARRKGVPWAMGSPNMASLISAWASTWIRPDGAMFLGDGPQDRIGDRVIATQRQRLAAFAQDAIIGIGDDVHAFRQVEGIDRHIADIGHHQAVDRVRPAWPCCRGGSGRIRPGSAAGHGACRRGSRRRCPAGCRRSRHRDPLVRRLGRQAHHGGWAAEARHFIAAQRLIEFLYHCITHHRWAFSVA